jgi:hypothetical protein
LFTTRVRCARFFRVRGGGGAGQMARGLRRKVAIRRQPEGPLRRQGLRDAGAVCGGEPFQGVVAALS